MNFGYFGILVTQASVLTRYPLTSYFIDYAHVLALAFMYFISCAMSFIAYTMRGRPFVVVGLWITVMFTLALLLLQTC